MQKASLLGDYIVSGRAARDTAGMEAKQGTQRSMTWAAGLC